MKSRVVTGHKQHFSSKVCLCLGQTHRALSHSRHGRGRNPSMCFCPQKPGRPWSVTHQQCRNLPLGCLGARPLLFLYDRRCNPQVSPATYTQTVAMSASHGNWPRGRGWVAKKSKPPLHGLEVKGVHLGFRRPGSLLGRVLLLLSETCLLMTIVQDAGGHGVGARIGWPCVSIQTLG